MKKIILADGAFGTYLYQKGIPIEKNFSLLNIENQELIKSIHLEYIKAGSELIETNTFSANLYKIFDPELCYKVNLYGAIIAKQASNGKALVAGSIGPTGKLLYPFSDIKKEDLKKFFLPQIQGLLDGNVDLLAVETQTLIEEAEEILKAIKELNKNIPILLSFTFNEDKKTPYGATIKDVVEIAEKYKVDYVGANCGLGPSYFLDLIKEFSYLTKIPFSVMPNAGLPIMKKGTFIYSCYPDYFTNNMLKISNFGVAIIGGCCGTEPKHIAHLKIQLNNLPNLTNNTFSFYIQDKKKSKFHLNEENLFKEKIQKKDFIISIETYPPKGFLTNKNYTYLSNLKNLNIQFINVVDLPMAKMRMSGIAFAHIMKEKFNFEPILHFTCRNRNILSIYGDLLGARALGIKNILSLTGDPPTIGDYPHASANYDLTNIGLLNLIKLLNEGKDIAYKDIDVVYDFFTGTSLSYNDLHDTSKILEKISAGANFFFSQPIFENFFIEKYSNEFKIPIIIGILICKDYEQLEYFAKEVPDIAIPDKILNQFKINKNNFLEFQNDFLLNLILEVKNLINGIYIIAPGLNFEYLKSFIFKLYKIL